MGLWSDIKNVFSGSASAAAVTEQQAVDLTAEPRILREGQWTRGSNLNETEEWVRDAAWEVREVIGQSTEGYHYGIQSSPDKDGVIKWSAPEKDMELIKEMAAEGMFFALHDSVRNSYVTGGQEIDEKEDQQQAIHMENLRDAEELAIINQWADDLQSGVLPEVAESNAVARIEAWHARAPEEGFVCIDLDAVRTLAQQQVQSTQSSKADPYSLLLQEHGNMLRAEATRSITTHWTSSLERGADPQKAELWAENRVRQYNANMTGAEIDFATIRDVINEHRTLGIRQSSSEVIGHSIRI